MEYTITFSPVQGSNIQCIVTVEGCKTKLVCCKQGLHIWDYINSKGELFVPNGRIRNKFYKILCDFKEKHPEAFDS